METNPKQPRKDLEIELMINSDYAVHIHTTFDLTPIFYELEGDIKRIEGVNTVLFEHNRYKLQVWIGRLFSKPPHIDRIKQELYAIFDKHVPYQEEAE